MKHEKPITMKRERRKFETDEFLEQVNKLKELEKTANQISELWRTIIDSVDELRMSDKKFLHNGKLIKLYEEACKNCKQSSAVSSLPGDIHKEMYDDAHYNEIHNKNHEHIN
jgi:hypothetical protein